MHAGPLRDGGCGVRKSLRLGMSVVAGSLLAFASVDARAQLSSVPHVAQANSALAEAEASIARSKALYSQGKYEDAIAPLQRAISILEQERGPNHPEVAIALNGLAGIYRVQQNYAEAESLLRRSLDILAEQLGSEHPGVAVGQQNLAELLAEQGRYAEAELPLRRAIAILKTQLGSEHPDVAASLSTLAGLHLKQAHYEAAKSAYLKAIAILEKQFGEDHIDIAANRNNLAIVYYHQGQYAEAESQASRVFSMLESQSSPEPINLAASLNTLAVIYADRGKYTEAEPRYLRALEIRRKHLGPDHPVVATTHNNLAALYESQGRYEDAEASYLHALDIRERQLGSDHLDVANSLNNLATLYQIQERFAEAESKYLQAQAIREQKLDADHPDIANGFHNLATLYEAQGKYAEGEPYSLQALAIQEKRLGSDHPYVATSLNHLATIDMHRGTYQDAEARYRRALAIREHHLGTEHPDVATSLNNLAVLQVERGQYADAIAYLRRGTNIEEVILTSNLGVGSERQKRQFINRFQGTTNVALSLHFDRIPDNEEAAQLGLTTLLRRKGRVLDVFSESLLNVRQSLAPEDRALFDRLAEVRSAIATHFAKGSGESPDEIRAYRQTLLDLRAEDTRIQDALAARSTAFRQTSHPVTLDAVRRAIPTHAALIEFVQYRPFEDGTTHPGDRFDSPRYAAYILHPDGSLAWRDLGEASEIDDLIRLYHANITRSWEAYSKALYARLFAPIQAELGSAEHLLIAPDSAINVLPFAALMDERDRFLLETYRITYLTSGRDLLRKPLPNTRLQPPLLLADPTFDAASEAAGSSNETPSNRRSTRLANMRFGPLPFTAAEAKAIAPLFPDLVALTGSAATENALKQAQNPQFLHIATHGFFEGDRAPITPDADDSDRTPHEIENPLLLSGLALAGFNERKSGREDGVLTALEVTGLNLLGTQLVVLSACDTGLGNIEQGEGVYGLRRAFTLAGAQSQLMSLWSVDDAATQELMVNYYQRLQQGEGRSEALRQVQLDMLKDPSRLAPFFWAAFIPTGNWQPLEP